MRQGGANGIRCIAAPCPSLTEKALNSSRKMNISEVDFAAGDKTTSLPAIIVAGDRFTYKVGGRCGKGRTATQAYRNVANIAPMTSGPTVNDGCFIGGCSGQICSDTEGLIRTCQFLPEYACYRAPTATCEQQRTATAGGPRMPTSSPASRIRPRSD